MERLSNDNDIVIVISNHMMKIMNIVYYYRYL